MKRIIAMGLILLFACAAFTAVSAEACQTCGCQLKKAADAAADTCVCDDKAWYKPQTWFKKCPVCANK